VNCEPGPRRTPADSGLLLAVQPLSCEEPGEVPKATAAELRPFGCGAPACCSTLSRCCAAQLCGCAGELWAAHAAAVAGAAAAVTLVVSVALSPPHPYAAVLAAILSWLAFYAHTLRGECQRLAAPAKGCAEEPHQSAYSGTGSCDLISRAGLMGVVPPSSSCGADVTMQAVLTAALVNEHLRCAAVLRGYQEAYGVVAHAPHFDSSLVEALLGSLGAYLQPPSQLHVQIDLDGSIAEERSFMEPQGEASLYAPRGSREEAPAAAPEPDATPIPKVEDTSSMPEWLLQIRR